MYRPVVSSTRMAVFPTLIRGMILARPHYVWVADMIYIELGTCAIHLAVTVTRILLTSGRA